MASLKNALLKPLGTLESTVLFLILALSLFDSFTTLFIYITATGIELNPITAVLLRINPFLVYPFSVSFLLVILLFRFNTATEYGVMMLLGTISLIASINNMGVLFFEHSIVVRLFGGLVDTQFFAFIIGLFSISGYSLYRNISAHDSRWRSIKTIAINITTYLVAYTLLSLMSISWLIGLRFL